MPSNTVAVVYDVPSPRLVGVEPNPGPLWATNQPTPSPRAVHRYVAARLRRLTALTVADIAMVLDSPTRTVAGWIADYKDVTAIEECEDAPRSGRPGVVGNPEVEAVIGEMDDVDDDDRPSKRARLTRRHLVGAVYQATGTELSESTVSNVLHSLGYAYRAVRPVPALTSESKERRLAFARAHQSTNWKLVLFTDEKTFELSHHLRKMWVTMGTHPTGPVVAHPAKVHCFAGVGHFFKFEAKTFRGILDAETLCLLIESCLPPTIAADSPPACAERFIMQHDNDPKYTSAFTQRFLDEHKVERIVDWPAYSPDLNPLDNVWSEVQRLVDLEEPQNIAELEAAVLKVWSKLDFGYIRRFVDSMPSRLAEVVQAEGGNTRY